VLRHRDEAAVIGARYLDRFPKGSSAPVVRALLDKLRTQAK